MSWNGSNTASDSSVRGTKNEARGASTPCKTHGTKRAARGTTHGLFAGLIVVALGGAAVWYFTRSAPPPPARSTKHEARDAITTVVPAVTNAPPAAQVTTNAVKTGRTEKDWPPPDAYQDERGIWRHPGGMRVFDPRDRERAIKSPTKSNIPKFNHPVEREIATLLTVKPGMTLVGTPRYDMLRKDLANALIDKIEISEDDSERDRRIKEEVIEAKKELVERVKNGEDVVEILKETRQELQRLSQYKREIQTLINEQVRDAENSDQDVADVFEAANRMLEEKGIAPLSPTPILRRRHQVLINEARRAEERK